ncbi:MAG: hypothetical protein LYZ69_02440 [Nitrososphaerales archaeon]|nr:hypothetical protein [Nitrososphaerales archaeon]
MSEPNSREWDLRDVENWFETEGSVGRLHRRIVITQRDPRPLEKIRGALRRELGIEKCRIARKNTGYDLWLPIEESAIFAKHFKSRVKTEKAVRDLELERLILEPAKTVRKTRKKAREILLS